MPPSRPSIIGLLFGSGPANISWLVIAVIVGIAIKAVEFGRSAAGVSQEYLKRRSPFLTDRDASTSIQFPVLGFVVKTTTLHTAPRLILRTEFAAATVAVCALNFSITSTRLNAPVFQRIPAGDGFVTAVTKAPKELVIPVSVAPSQVLDLVNHGKFTESH